MHENVQWMIQRNYDEMNVIRPDEKNKRNRGVEKVMGARGSTRWGYASLLACCVALERRALRVDIDLLA